ncbi:ECF transporter S component [Pontibacillus yanchengensis]|uniref:Riboflavin transporter n=1 Tax=Pontibacillus yanchengensis Y32 TaxID=1385514 RepID=A0A0A2T908_9BACI|nr:ECF transporter S component [Pontibacillus yanchengensis]KGP72044.1 riboflavin transporter FmnP [Pontibacillus yanchengensis Y32]
MQPSKGRSSKLLKLITLSLMSTISLLLMLLDFPLPLLPGFLKVDLSDVPALFAALLFSPIAGVIVEAIKNLLHFILGSGDPIGASANFFAGLMLVLPVSMIYHRYKSVKSVVSGLVTGTIVMAVGMSVLNYFVILPAYTWMMGFELEGTKLGYITAGIIPFNVVKGILVGILFVPLFVKLKPWFEQKRVNVT